ncbi:hypothetical protein EBZ80_17055 [bacterium]|nr:hypothetical protein [bacterium]
MPAMHRSIAGAVSHSALVVKYFLHVVLFRILHWAAATSKPTTAAVSSWWMLPAPSVTMKQTAGDGSTVQDVAYVLWPHESVYRLRLPCLRGPRTVDVLAVSESRADGTCWDVTTYVLSYLGPNLDWHRQRYTPALLGLEELTFYFIDDTLGYEEQVHVVGKNQLLEAPTEWVVWESEYDPVSIDDE